MLSRTLSFRSFPQPVLQKTGMFHNSSLSSCERFLVNLERTVSLLPRIQLIHTTMIILMMNVTPWPPQMIRWCLNNILQFGGVCKGSGFYQSPIQSRGDFHNHLTQCLHIFHLLGWKNNVYLGNRRKAMTFNNILYQHGRNFVIFQAITPPHLYWGRR